MSSMPEGLELPSSDWVQEGEVSFRVGAAFFRQESRVARDLGVLAAAIYRQDHPQLHVLDAMSGCGVRSLRYGLEAKADHIWANEGNLDAAEGLRHNLRAQLPQAQVTLTIGSTHRLLHECLQKQQYFDLVDLDCFGHPSAYLSNCMQVTRLGGLMYLTTTDSRTCAGHNPGASLKYFGAYARSHPAVHEQGLRLLLGSTMQQALMLGWEIVPIFSFFQGQIYRVMVRLSKGQTWHEKKFGFIGYCHTCGQYQTVSWRGLSGANCPYHQQNTPLTLSGPLWLGPLHNEAYLGKMRELAQQWHWAERDQLLAIMAAEISFPPYFLPLAELGRRGKMDIPKRDRLIAALQDQGYGAVMTHINPQAIKTTASFRDCLAIAQQLRSQKQNGHCTNSSIFPSPA